MCKPIRAIVADEFDIVREGLIARLNCDPCIDVVADTSSVDKTLEAIAQYNSDVLLLDLKIAGGTTAAFLSNLAATAKDTAVIALSSELKKFDMYLSLSKGAAGYLSKQARGDDYVRAVKAVAAGYAFIPSEMIDDIRLSYQRLTRTGNMYGLSPREIEVLEAGRNGRSARQIAGLLDISVRTVETHRCSIYRKTDCRNLEDIFYLFESV